MNAEVDPTTLFKINFAGSSMRSVAATKAKLIEIIVRMACGIVKIQNCRHSKNRAARAVLENIDMKPFFNHTCLGHLGAFCFVFFSVDSSLVAPDYFGAISSVGLTKCYDVK